MRELKFTSTSAAYISPDNLAQEALRKPFIDQLLRNSMPIATKSLLIRKEDLSISALNHTVMLFANHSRS